MRLPEQLLAAARVVARRARQEPAFDRHEEEEEHADGQVGRRGGRRRARARKSAADRTAFRRTVASVSAMPNRIEVARVVR